MAKLNREKLFLIEKRNAKKHIEVNSSYSIYKVKGVKYFQLDTYGNPDRVMPDKISQSIQIDHEVAVKLIKLLEDTFDIKR